MKSSQVVCWVCGLRSTRAERRQRRRGGGDPTQYKARCTCSLTGIWAVSLGDVCLDSSEREGKVGEIDTKENLHRCSLFKREKKRIRTEKYLLEFISRIIRAMQFWISLLTLSYLCEQRMFTFGVLCTNWVRVKAGVAGEVNSSGGPELCHRVRI